MWFEFKGQMQSIYKQAYCIFLFILFFYSFGFMKKKGVNGLGKEKDKGRKYLFSCPFTFLSTFGGECVKDQEFIILLKSDE